MPEPIRIVRHSRARRYVLRLAPDGSLRLTVPRRASIAGGLKFIERQQDWIERERERMGERATPWTFDTELWWRGERATVGELPELHALLAGAGLHASANLRETAEAHLREIAVRELPPRCLAFARAHAVAISRVTIRNQRSRWGACSSRGAITLNWRLLQMPPDICDYVILHELMHRRQPNHSRKFWREVASVCPGWQDAERWLRKNGRAIL